MNTNRTSVAQTGKTDYLSVIHKNPLLTGEEILDQSNPVIQTDLDFNITGWNPAAETLHGQPGAMGANLFELVQIKFIGSSLADLKNSLSRYSSWTGEVAFKRYDGKQIHFKTTATYIINEKVEPVAIMIVSHDVSDAKKKEEELAAAEKRYEILVNTLPEGVIMMNAAGRITACNKRGAAILGLAENDTLGRMVCCGDWDAVRKDGTPFPVAEFPAMVSLQTGFPQRNVIIGITKPGGMLTWLSVNTQALIRTGEFEPYAVVISYSDITESINTEKELQKVNARFYYVSKVTSDAIWDLDMQTNEIYRSDAFYILSGYTTEETCPTLNWWFENLHPDDRDRVQNKLNEHIQQGEERWCDEYRFKCADGSYKFLLDSGMIRYRNGKAVRILGAIRDLTKQKDLEKQLFDEQAQKHQSITLATITAQEQEKTKISHELHDNVNQILMSAKLYMDTAKRLPEEANELLDKAIEYQLLALEEIRKLSKSLNTSHIKKVGLKESVQDIVDNMKMQNNLEVDFDFDHGVDKLLTDDQKLMIFRIIQEQTSNILKHADAKKVILKISGTHKFIYLHISDDGIGFDPATINKDKGIGLINIRSRAEAYNGTVEISSAPGKGCMVDLQFPVFSGGGA